MAAGGWSARKTSAFVAAVAYNPPPPGKGYLMRLAAPSNAARTINTGPFCQFVQAMQDNDGNLYVTTNPDRAAQTQPLPDPEALRPMLRPDPSLLPEPSPLPAPAAGHDVRAEILEASDGDRISGVTTNTIGYYRKLFPDASLRVRNGKVYKGIAPLRHDPDPLDPQEYGVHAYLDRYTPGRSIPQDMKDRVLTDIAGDRHSRYLRCNAPLSEREVAFLAKHGHFAYAVAEQADTVRQQTEGFFTPFNVYPPERVVQPKEEP